MKKKILHVSAGGLGHGGVSTVIFSIVKSLHTQFDFGCVVYARERERDTYFTKYGKIHRINCYPKKGKRNYFELITRPYKLYWGIRKICKEQSYDVIHCHNQRDEWICLLAAKHAGVPIRIAHSHNPDSPKKKSFVERFYKKLSPKMMKKTATVNLGCSKFACEDFYRHDQYIVVPNAIDLNKYSVPPQRSEQGMQFIRVGRYTYQKNQEFVLETFAQICKAFPQAHLYLVGYGEPFETERLRALIQTLGIIEQVEMVPGDTADIRSYYEKSKYMIFPSRFEGFGIVLIEAQSMGISCYVSEAIQEEADVGLLTFLNLSDGPEKWAEVIVADIKSGNKKTCNKELLLRFGEEEICKKYAALYNGEKL